MPDRKLTTIPISVFISVIVFAVPLVGTTTWGLSSNARVRDMKDFVKEYHYQLDTNTTRINSHEDHIMTARDDRAQIKLEQAQNQTILETIAEDVREIISEIKELRTRQ